MRPSCVSARAKSWRTTGTKSRWPRTVARPLPNVPSGAPTQCSWTSRCPKWTVWRRSRKFARSTHPRAWQWSRRWVNRQWSWRPSRPGRRILCSSRSSRTAFWRLCTSCWPPSMPIRVLVVDDSAFMRRVVSEAIVAQPDMELAGVAINGLDALGKVEQLHPDVVTLDVEMPELDGLSEFRHLMSRYPRPVVMLSNQTQEGAVTTLRALSIGAVDFVAKPSAAISLDFHRVKEELLYKIRIA